MPENNRSAVSCELARGEGASRMRLVRWFVGGTVIALILVLAIVAWIDRSTTVQVVVSSLPPRQIHVQVEGAVATPGVVVVPGDARLIDVVNAAGGFSEDVNLASLNLAGRVGDGERVVIPNTAIAGAAEPDLAPSGSEARGGRVNINVASVSELEDLPGIGKVLAGRIIEYRDEHGTFTSVDELANITGISSRLVEDLRPLVTIDDDDS